MQERGLARSGFTNQDGDGFRRGQAVLKISERLPVQRREKQKLRVRRDLERQLPKPVEFLIHGLDYLMCSVENATTATHTSTTTAAARCFSMERRRVARRS